METPAPTPDPAAPVPFVRPVEGARWIDNFCPRIADVRASALASGFNTWRPPQGISGHKEYDGMNFKGLHSLMVVSLEFATGARAYTNTPFFRITTPETEKAYIHSDRHDGVKTCICYMSEHDGISGTAFFRHKPTGWMRMPPVAWLRENAVGTIPPLKDGKPDPQPGVHYFGTVPVGWKEGANIFDCLWSDMQNTGPDIWEELDFVRGLYNRALIFDAPLFHQRRQPESIETDPAKARMVWVAHYHTEETVESQLLT